MKHLKYYLEKIRISERRKYHPLIHHVHKKHRISKKTLFYVKEYGPHSNIPKRIIKESIKILLLASIISSFGGLALENIKTLFISVYPLIILLPVLNDQIGNYGTIISAKFSTMLHEDKIKKKWWKNKELKVLFRQLTLMAILTAVISSTIALIISNVTAHKTDFTLISNIIAITLIDVLFLVMILFLVAVVSGIYLYKKQEDPNNFLIPITTSIADFGNMIILSLLILFFF